MLNLEQIKLGALVIGLLLLTSYLGYSLVKDNMNASNYLTCMKAGYGEGTCAHYLRLLQGVKEQ